MLSANRIKFLRSLSTKKARNDEGLFIVEGVKPVDELLSSGFKIHSVYGLEGWINNHTERLTQLGVEHFTLNPTDLERISQLNTPNQVFAVGVQRQAHYNLADLGKGLVLALDNVTDPGNLGTIIRIADWFGAAAVVCSPGTVEVYNPKTVQSAMGSLFRVPVHYMPLDSFIADYKNVHQANGVYAAVLGGNDLYTAGAALPCLLVMGSESHGISAAIVDMATHKVTIPAYGNSGAESLNVAVSTAIICAELRRVS